MYKLHLGNSLEILQDIPSGRIDCVISDPPYPEIDRPYGRLSESSWRDLMTKTALECRRVLKPTGSAVFILQPNYKRVGSMRSWLWEFMVWVCQEWNIIQDVWWWNVSAMPAAGATEHGLLRQSIKACVWAGEPDCYRDQSKVLWTETQSNAQSRAKERFVGRRESPSGHGKSTSIYMAAKKRGGVTPFNLLPISNGQRPDSAGNFGHSAGTPFELADWWTRYICPTDGVVLDPFMGSGTMGIAAIRNGCNFIGIEKEKQYYDVAAHRIQEASMQGLLLMDVFKPDEEEELTLFQ